MPELVPIVHLESAPHVSAANIPVPVTGVALYEYAEIKPFPGGTQRFEVMPGSETPLDQHASHEMWFIGAGEGELLFDGQWHPIKAGDSVYFPAQQTHRMRNSGTTPMTIFSVWWREAHAQG